MGGSAHKVLVAAAALAWLFASGCTGGGDGSDERARVLVFGIDGGTWDVMDELLAAGEMPNLKSLYDAGIHGVLESRPPALSPVVWSTIFTGKLPKEHGVANWKTSHSQHRKVKAVWDITSDAEIATHVFNVPSTWPPTPVTGVMLSGFPLSGSTIGGNTGAVTSREGIKTARLAPCHTYNAEVVGEQMDALGVGEWGPYFEAAIRGRPSWKAWMRIKRLGEDSYYLTPCYRTDADMVMSYPDEVRAQVDAELGEPYVPEGPGWSKWAEPETPEYLAEHLAQVARNQTRAATMFASTPWNLLVFINTLVDRVSHPYWAYMRPDDYPTIDRDKAGRYEDVVREAYRETDRQLGELLAPVDGKFYVVMASDHGFHSSRDKTKFIGAHHFDGIYLVAGPGLTGVEGKRVFIEDVAPTILYLMGMPLGEDMAGKVMPDVLTQVGRPVKYVASYEDGSLEGTDQPVDDKTWEQLKGLGYVDGESPRQQQKKKAQ